MQPPEILRNKKGELFARFGKTKLTPSQTRQAHRDGNYCGCKTCTACLIADALHTLQHSKEK